MVGEKGMDDRRGLVDEIEVQRIVRAAAAMMQKPRTKPEVRKQLLGFVQLIEAECQSVEDDRRALNPATLLNLIEAAFAVGAIAGTPGMVTGLRAGQHALAGEMSGKARRGPAEKRQAHAIELMVAIRSERPWSSQEDVAAEARERWKLDELKALGISSLVKLLRALEKNGAVPAQAPE